MGHQSFDLLSASDQILVEIWQNAPLLSFKLIVASNEQENGECPKMVNALKLTHYLAAMKMITRHDVVFP